MAKKNDNQQTNPVKELLDQNLEQMEVMRKRVKTGGRKKGTQNKVTGELKAVICDLLSEYQDSGLMYSDFLLLPPEKRLLVAKDLFPYALPKLQSTQIDLSTDNTKLTIEKKLQDLSKDPEEE